MKQITKYKKCLLHFSIKRELYNRLVWKKYISNNILQVKKEKKKEKVSFN